MSRPQCLNEMERQVAPSKAATSRRSPRQPVQREAMDCGDLSPLFFAADLSAFIASVHPIRLE
jgi:hypothetical protein